MRRKNGKRFTAFVLAFGLVLGAVPVFELETKAAETEAEQIAAELTAPVVESGDFKISMPETEDGVSVRFLADYEQIIGEDGTIYQPLEEKTVKGFYEVICEANADIEGSEAKTGEFTVVVPGRYTDHASANPRPEVIPALQEWHGGTGDFFISAAGRILAGDPKLMAAAQAFAEDYKDITGLDIEVINGTQEEIRIGDFYLSLAQGKGLGKEGYTMEIGSAVTVEAEDAAGAYWATRSILQILKQTGGSIPKGLVRDYPKYEVRGLNLDVARKPFTIEALYDFVKNMSWYKLNSFQVHLSDNLIFMEDYPSRDAAIEQAYAGYRLESEVTNADGESATSEDVYYTKDEFRQLIKDSRAIGVDIVPELDFPAHALAFTRVFSEYMSEGFNRAQFSQASGQYRPLIDEWDISKSGAVELVKEIWDEYLEGEDPVFDEETTVHIGTDEFHGGGSQSNEYFREFSNELITYIQEKGRTVRMWGSLSNKSGSKPVASEGVQVNIWSVDYGRPKEMYDLGYGLINTSDSWLYMVPSGNGSRGAYGDYLQVQNIYNSWQVNEMYTNTSYGYTVPAGDEQMLGACFAIWNDNIDTRASGISQYDSLLRFLDAAPVFSEKVWGDGASQKAYADFVKTAAVVDAAPNTMLGAKQDSITNTIAAYTFEDTLQKDSSFNGFDLGKTVNAKVVAGGGEKALQLNGGVSYVETPLNMSEPGAALTMRVKMDADAQDEQILCESKDKFGSEGAYAIKAAVKQTGNVGFSREGYDYSFDYKLPADEWVELTFYSGENKNVSLRVRDLDGETVYSNPKFYYKTHLDTEMSAARGNSRVSTLLIPFGHIGSDTDSFQGQIANVTLTGTKTMPAGQGAIPHEEMTVSACSEAPRSADLTEGPADYAIDGNESTYWHTDWNDDISISEEEPHYFEITLNTPKVIDRLTYLPRQDSANGRIYQYSIEVTAPDGAKKLVAEKANWAKDNSLKTASFDPVEAKSIKLIIYDAQGNQDGVHATIAELNLFEPSEFNADVLREELSKADAYEKSDYTDASWAVLERAKETARKIIAAAGSTQEEYLYAYELLQQAAAGLIALEDVMPGVDQRRYQLASAIKEAEEKLNLAEDYTQASVKEFTDALNAANAFLRKDNATEQELAHALSALQSVKLVTKISYKREELSRAAEDARKKLADTSGYTAASVEALRQALQNADRILAKENASLAELTNALTALLGKELIKAQDPPVNQTPQAKLKKGQQATVGGVKYKVTDADKNEVTITKGKNTQNVKIGGTVSIDGITCKITGIAASAYKNFGKIKKVTIGSSVTNIGKNAFTGCGAMTSVTMGKNVKAVGAKAFYNCKKLKKVVLLGKKAPSIGKNAFGKTASKITVQAKGLNKKARKALLNKMKKNGGAGSKASVK